MGMKRVEIITLAALFSLPKQSHRKLSATNGLTDKEAGVKNQRIEEFLTVDY
jgi:hypothetical protein